MESWRHGSRQGSSVSAPTRTMPREDHHRHISRMAPDDGDHNEERFGSMISQLYVVGGEQREPRGVSAGMGDWYRFKRALILSVDTDADTVVVAAQHVSPLGSCPEVEPAILFKSSSVRGDRLYACTQTEVLVYQLPDFELIHYLSLPFFNDLHHVLPTDVGTLLVAISGLDMVVEIQMDGTVVK